MSIKLILDESLCDKGEAKLEIEVDGGIISQCLDYAFEIKPALKKAIFIENGDFISGIFFKINEKYIYSDALEILATPVKERDEIEIIYAPSG